MRREDFDVRLQRRRVVELSADIRLHALQIIAEIFRNHRIGPGVVDDDEMSGFLVGKAIHHVQQTQIIGGRQVEWVEFVGRVEDDMGSFARRRSGCRASRDRFGRRSTRARGSMAILYFSAARGYCRIEASCSATSK